MKADVPPANEQGKKRPAYQWYPGDFKRDTALQACSFEARSLWREMLDLMHDGEPYGHLTAGGVPINDAALARMIGIKPGKCVAWLFELESRGVFSRTPKGVIYSRRMVKDEHIRIVRAQAGRLGGNPSLVKQPDNLAAKEKPTPAVAVAVATARTATPGASRAGWLDPVAAVYESAKGPGSFPWAKAGKLLKPLHEAGHSGDVIAERLARYVAWLDDQKYFSLSKFRETFGDYAEKEPAAIRALKGYPKIVDEYGQFTEYGERVTRPNLKLA
jgi:hypothetical protein